MAADLMGSSDIPQTFVHDLESFFWVMLWIVKTLVPSSWSPSTRSEIDAIMNPKSCGSEAKKLFCKGIQSSWMVYRFPIIPPFANF